jgi:hypothetical protein
MYCLVLGVIRIHLPVPRTAPPRHTSAYFSAPVIVSLPSWAPPSSFPPSRGVPISTLRQLLHIYAPSIIPYELSGPHHESPQHSRNHPFTTETPLSAPLAASLSSRRSSIEDEGRNATAELRSILICQIWEKSIFYCWEAPNYKGVC